MIFTEIVNETKTKTLNPISKTGAYDVFDKFLEYFQYCIVLYVLTSDGNNISYLASTRKFIYI